MQVRTSDISLSTPAGFQHEFGTVDGIRLHFVTGGVPELGTLILLAGFPESWFAWRRMLPSLAQRFRIIAVDLPGQGDSDKPQDGYDTASIATILHELLSKLGINQYGVVAHDVGAWVAFPYAMMYPAEVSRLILMDAGIPGVTLPESLPTDPAKGWRTWHFPFHAVPDLPEALITGRERIYLDWFLRRKTANPFTFSESDVDEYLRVFSLPGALRAGLAFYRSAALSAQQNRELALNAKLSMPVLALSADQGSIPDMAASLRPYADNVRGATVSHCGHFLPEEQPNAVAELITKFFESES